MMSGGVVVEMGLGATDQREGDSHDYLSNQEGQQRLMRHSILQMHFGRLEGGRVRG